MFDQDQLIAYVCGTATPDEQRQIEEQLSTNKFLNKKLDEIRTVMEKVSTSLSEEPPSNQLRSRILDSVACSGRFGAYAERLSEFLDLSRDAVIRVLALCNDSTTSSWEQSPIPGTQLLHFAGGPRVADADCGLITIEAGHEFPMHKHVGDEWAFVIQGAVLEQDGQRFYPGDISYRAAGSQHSFKSVGDEPLMLVVVVHEGVEFDIK